MCEILVFKVVDILERVDHKTEGRNWRELEGPRVDLKTWKSTQSAHSCHDYTECSFYNGQGSFLSSSCVQTLGALFLPPLVAKTG